MTYLLDVNVLIALTDRAHVHHTAAVRWFESVGSISWATCPITENGVLRIVGSPRYRNSVGTLTDLSRALQEFTALPGHVFWADTISLLRGEPLNFTDIIHPNQITDIYLLLLAKTNGGQLATFDRRIPVETMADGASLVCLITD
jgi:toxin-antitoxin system PIN domain toxin